MTGSKEGLTPDQTELVAVGASVGAGCHPCVKHHIKAALKAGVEEQRLVAALTSSDRVSAEASERMSAHSRGVLGVESTASATMASSLDDALASFGAAVAANDGAAIRAQIAAARAAGASDLQLREAIRAAEMVQENAARIHVREAERLVERSATGAEEPADATGEPGCDDDCPCDAEEGSETEAGAAAAHESERCGCDPDPGGDSDEAPGTSRAERMAAEMARCAPSGLQKPGQWPCVPGGVS